MRSNKKSINHMRSNKKIINHMRSNKKSINHMRSNKKRNSRLAHVTAVVKSNVRIAWFM